MIVLVVMVMVSIEVGVVCVSDRRVSGKCSTPYLIYGTVEGFRHLARPYGASGA